MTNEIAKLFTINWQDILKGFITAVLTVIVAGLYTGLSSTPPQFPDLATLEHLGITGLLAGVAYLMKNFLSNSAGQFLKAEGAPMPPVAK